MAVRTVQAGNLRPARQARQKREPNPLRQRFPFDLGDGVCILIGLLALGLCLRAIWDPFTWMLLLLLVPALRFATIASFRRRVIDRIRGLWQQLDGYAKGHGRTPWLAAFVFAGLPTAGLYLYDDRCITSDSAPVVPTAVSVLREGNWELSEYSVAQAGDSLPYYLCRRPAGIYSAYPAGMVFFALPMTAGALLAGADFGNPDAFGRLEKWTSVWVAAACLTLYFLLCLRLAPPEPALLCTGLLATGSVLYSTVGQALWQHGGVILWMLLILLIEFGRNARPSRVGVALQGIAAAGMVACRLSAAVFLAPFALWLLVRAPRRAMAVSALAALAYLPWAMLYQSIYGTMFGPSVG
jgi:hypothetical protein